MSKRKIDLQVKIQRLRIALIALSGFFTPLGVFVGIKFGLEQWGTALVALAVLTCLSVTYEVLVWTMMIRLTGKGGNR